MMKTRSMCWKIGHTLLASALLLMSLLQSSTVQGAEQGEPGNNADLLIVVGAGGEASYGEMFLEWATMLEAVGEEAQARVELLGSLDSDSTKGSLKDLLKKKLENHLNLLR